MREHKAWVVNKDVAARLDAVWKGSEELLVLEQPPPAELVESLEGR